MKLYHATFKPYLKSIQRLGLGAKQPKKNYEDSLDGVVCFASDKDEAYSYAEVALDDEDNHPNELGIVILEVDATDLNPEWLHTDSNVQDTTSCFEYHGIIPWDKIKVCRA